MPNLLLLTAFIALPVVAQSPGEIVVTGQRLPAGLGDLAYDIKVIDRAALGASASGRLEDVFRDAAGFHLFRRSASRSAHPTRQGATREQETRGGTQCVIKLSYKWSAKQ